MLLGIVGLFGGYIGFVGGYVFHQRRLVAHSDLYRGDFGT